jgi:trehalose synthase
MFCFIIGRVREQTVKTQDRGLNDHRFRLNGEGRGLLRQYRDFIGREAVAELKGYRKRFAGRRIIHVNSTFAGGGVAEILAKEVPLTNELGITTEWYKIKADEAFFNTTKGFHNALQGRKHDDPAALVERYNDFYNNGGGLLNKSLIEYLESLTREDVVIIHDPQPLYLVQYMDEIKAVKLWRSHIDTTTPDPHIMSYVAAQAARYDGIIATRREYVDPHLNGFRNIYALAPSIDPFSDKNGDMDLQEIVTRVGRCGIRDGKPLLVQVSRLDPWKDPVGVIHVFEKIRGYGKDCQLALVYNSADDDPEGAVMERIVKECRDRSPLRQDIHLVSGDDPRDVNAFQRYATLVIQKSIREGFGLTVTEALFKGTPVVVTEVGGIAMQVENGLTGFTVKPYRLNDRAQPASPAEYERHIDEFAGACIRALNIREEHTIIGERARKTVIEKYFATSKLKNLLNIILKCDSKQRSVQ